MDDQRERARLARRQKRWILVVSAVAIVSLVLLAASLSSLELLPGQPRPEYREATDDSPAGPLPNFRRLDVLFAWISIALVVLLLLIAVVYMFLSPNVRNRVLAVLILLGLCFFGYLILRDRPEVAPPIAQVTLTPQPTAEVTAEIEIVAGKDRPIFEFSYAPPRWLTLLVAAGLGLLVAALAVGLGWAAWQLRWPNDSLDQLAAEAQRALDTLHAGADVKDTVLRCYFEMSRILVERRGLERAQGMTPREFERQLKTTGLPRASVEQLTRLFERVRYSTRAASQQDEQLAIASLEAIVQACRSEP